MECYTYLPPNFKLAPLVITFLRIVDDTTLINALKRSEWAGEPFEKEWTEKQILQLCRTNRIFAECLVTLFFEGATFDVLKDVLPLFELKKLTASKLKLTFDALIDTIVRYNVRGAYKANRLNNPEILLDALLKKDDCLMLDAQWISLYPIKLVRG